MTSSTFMSLNPTRLWLLLTDLIVVWHLLHNTKHRMTTLYYWHTRHFYSSQPFLLLLSLSPLIYIVTENENVVNDDEVVQSSISYSFHWLSLFCHNKFTIILRLKNKDRLFSFEYIDSTPIYTLIPSVIFWCCCDNVKLYTFCHVTNV